MARGKFKLKTANGNIVFTFADGRLGAMESQSAFDTFEIYEHKDGALSLKSCHDKYVIAKEDGQLLAHSKSFGDIAAKFEVLTHDGETISLRSAYGKYVVAHANGKLFANSASLGAWEKFVKVNIRHLTTAWGLKLADGRTLGAGVERIIRSFKGSMDENEAEKIRTLQDPERKWKNDKLIHAADLHKQGKFKEELVQMARMAAPQRTKGWIAEPTPSSPRRRVLRELKTPLTPETPVQLRKARRRC